MPYVSVHLSVNEILSDVSTKEIAEYLVKQDDYKNILNEAIAKHEKVTFERKDIEVDVAVLIEKYSNGKPINHDLSRIADVYFGKVV